jgi:hypothetical protein
MWRSLALAAVLTASWPAAAVAAQRYERCPPTGGMALVAVARAGCDEAGRVAAALAEVPVRATAAALAATGWTPLRARPVPGSRAPAHDVVALRGRAALRVRRAGDSPDLDSWQAGRELVFARGTIVGGRPVPRGAATCTSAFLVRLPGARLGGLSAAHCAGLRRDRRVQRRNVALRRPPAPGIVLGRVLRILTRRVPLDAVVVPTPRGPGRGAAPVINRGVSRPPWVVARTARALSGRRVCFTGRTSGIDRCGRVRGPGAAFGERLLSLRTGLVVRCTTIRARLGDSGGPVFTPPRGDGTVGAVGIVTLVAGRAGRMCFTPVGPSLRQLGAALATG